MMTNMINRFAQIEIFNYLPRAIITNEIQTFGTASCPFKLNNFTLSYGIFNIRLYQPSLHMYSDRACYDILNRCCLSG